MLDIYREGASYKYYKENGNLDNWKSTEEDISDEMKAWNSFLGAVFSLWRAVFITDPVNVSRKTENLDTHAEKFLFRLIADNQIHYPDEKKYSSWASGYYLNNAKYRLKSLVKSLKLKGIDIPKSITNEILKKVWNQLFFGLKKAFKVFKPRRVNARRGLRTY